MCTRRRWTLSAFDYKYIIHHFTSPSPWQLAQGQAPLPALAAAGNVLRNVLLELAPWWVVLLLPGLVAWVAPRWVAPRWVGLLWVHKSLAPLVPVLLAVVALRLFESPGLVLVVVEVVDHLM